MSSSIKKIATFFLFLLVKNGYSQLSLKIYALESVTIIDANHEKPLVNQTIIIRDGIIFKIFPTNSEKLADSISVFKLNGKFIIPGLIDTHVHLSGEALDADNTDKTKKVLEDMLYTGITSVRDMAGDARYLSFLSREAQIGIINSPNIYYAAIMAGPKFFTVEKTKVATRGGISGQMAFMQAVTDTTDIKLAVARAKGTGATAIKLYVYITKELAKKVIDEAAKQKIMIWSHASLNPAKPMDVVNSGAKVISHAEMLWSTKLDTIPRAWKRAEPTKLFWDEKVMTMGLEELFKQMKLKQTILDATLLYFVENLKEKPYSKWDTEMSFAITRMAYKAGVKISTGTDTDQKVFVQEEIKLLVKECGFSPFDAIVAATLNGAEATGISKTHGTVEVDKFADLIILAKNPLGDIENIKSVDFVIKSGKIFKPSN